MQEQIKEIASRIRELREISDISSDDMARQLSLVPEKYREYEEAKADIPASLLLEISKILKIEMTTLLTGENPRMNVYTVVRKDSGPSIERRSDYKYQSLAPNFIHKKAEPFIVKVEPKPADDVPHANAHPGQEFNYLLEGRMKLQIDASEIILEAGDSVYFDSTHEHYMMALDGKPARFIAIIF